LRRRVAADQCISTGVTAGWWEIVTTAFRSLTIFPAGAGPDIELDALFVLDEQGDLCASILLPALPDRDLPFFDYEQNIYSSR
jgi:hypothetical protein